MTTWGLLRAFRTVARRCGCAAARREEASGFAFAEVTAATERSLRATPTPRATRGPQTAPSHLADFTSPPPREEHVEPSIAIDCQPPPPCPPALRVRRSTLAAPPKLLPSFMAARQDRPSTHHTDRRYTLLRKSPPSFANHSKPPFPHYRLETLTPNQNIRRGNRTEINQESQSGRNQEMT